MDYGGWSFALSDYWLMNITSNLDSPAFAALSSIVDPLSYFNRISLLPIYNIQTSGDEFFLLDNIRFSRQFFKEASGGREPDSFFWQRQLPNCEHDLFFSWCRPVVIQGVCGWLANLLPSLWERRNTSSSLPLPLPLPPPSSLLPSFPFNISSSGSRICSFPQSLPSSPLLRVHMYSSHTINDTRRDFRLAVGSGPHHEKPFPSLSLWQSNIIEANEEGMYCGNIEIPAAGEGWNAFYLEGEFQSIDGKNTMAFTTDVSIVPQDYPFNECYGEECKGELV